MSLTCSKTKLTLSYLTMWFTVLPKGLISWNVEIFLCFQNEFALWLYIKHFLQFLRDLGCGFSTNVCMSSKPKFHVIDSSQKTSQSDKHETSPAPPPPSDCGGSTDSRSTDHSKESPSPNYWMFTGSDKCSYECNGWPNQKCIVSAIFQKLLAKT